MTEKSGEAPSQKAAEHSAPAESDSAAAEPSATNHDTALSESPDSVTESVAQRMNEGLDATSVGPLRNIRAQLSARRRDNKPVSKEAVPLAAEDGEGDAATAAKAIPLKKRDRLSPELEQEYQAALGDGSIEALMEESIPEKGSTELAPGTRVRGRVAKLHQDDVFFDLGGHNQGMVPLKQFEFPPQVDCEFELLVVDFVADEGLYTLSLPTAAVDVGNWDDVSEGQIVEAQVTGSNKGGLECQVAGLRGFMPMGQVSIYRVENTDEFIGQKLMCVVIEANPQRRNLVLSHRAVLERERNEKREALLADLAPGQIREGVVRNLRDFGAFVDLGGIDGLVHISKLSWERVNHPSDVLREGERIKVRVENVDRENGKIGLSYREVGANPWDKVDQKYHVGSIVSGTVTKLMDFGAFVKLEPGVEGLIHISEFAHGRVARTSDVLSEGQTVEVKVLSVDGDKQRISLSLRALLPEPARDDQEAVEEDSAAEDVRRAPRKQPANLKGGLGSASGGEQFGLKW